MPKPYTIEISYLERTLALLKKSNSPTSELDSIRLEEYIKRLKENYSSVENDNLRESLDEDEENLDYFEPFYKIIERITKTKVKKNTISYTKIILDNDTVLNLVEDFFKNQSNFYDKGYKEFKKNINNHLQFFKPNDNSDGEIIFLKSINESFVSIPDYSNICKLCIAVHELTHVIDAYHNPDFHYNLGIREIDALFMEMIAADYFSKKLNLEKDGNIRKLFLHNIIKSMINNIQNKTKMLLVYRKHKNAPLENFIANMELYGYTREQIEAYEKYNLVEDYYYVLPHFIAIELYFIYKSNKSKALLILEDIVNNGTDENIFELLEKHNIKITKNAKKYSKSLKHKLKNKH